MNRSASTASGPFWPVGILLALAAMLRFVQLDAGLWYDEIATLVDYVRVPWGELLTTYHSPNNHILFSLAAKASIAAFGESPWALRLPAVIAGVASIWALYRLGCRIADRTEALLAAALLTVSYHHVWFSQNARGYTGLLLFVLLATGLFLEGLRRPTWRIWGGYGVVAALAMYTHLSAIFVFAGHGVAYLVLEARRALSASGEHDRRGVDTWPLRGFAAGAALTLALYAVLIPQMIGAFGEQAGADSANVKVATWTNPVWTVLEVIRAMQLGALTLGVVAIAGLLITLGWLDYLRRRPLAAWLMVLNVPITLAVLLAIDFHIWPRYFFVNIGFVLLVLVRGLFLAGEAIAGRLAPGARDALAWRFAVGLLATLGLALMLPRNYALPKQDYGGAKGYVEAAAGSGDGIVTVGLATLAYEGFYAPDWRSVATAAELQRARRDAADTWVVYSFPTYMETAHPDVLELLARDFELVQEFPGTLGDGEIYVWRSR